PPRRAPAGWPRPAAGGGARPPSAARPSRRRPRSAGLREACPRTGWPRSEASGLTGNVAGSLPRDHAAPASTLVLVKVLALPADDRGRWLGARDPGTGQRYRPNH